MKQFTAYFAGGALAVALHLATLTILVENYQIDPLMATVTGFVVGVFFNYCYQYYITFKSRRSHRQALPMFVVFATVLLQLNASFFWLLTVKLEVHYFQAQVFSSGLVFIVNFILNRYFTFNQKGLAQTG